MSCYPHHSLTSLFVSLSLSVCPLPCLKLRIYKRSILQGQNIYGPGPSTGTGSEARITSSEREASCVPVLRKGCDNVDELILL